MDHSPTNADGVQDAVSADPVDSLNRAICAAGGAPQLAAKISVTKQAVYLWQRTGRVGAEYVLPIVRACDGEVRPSDLRPDLYPDPGWMPDLGEAAA